MQEFSKYFGLLARKGYFQLPEKLLEFGNVDISVILLADALSEAVIVVDFVLRQIRIELPEDSTPFLLC